MSDIVCVRVCELRCKEVINCRDCLRLGFVGDIEFNIKTGCVEKLIVPGPCKIWGILGRDHEYVIPWKCVKQIGIDLIIVDIDTAEALQKCPNIC